MFHPRTCFFYLSAGSIPPPRTLRALVSLPSHDRSCRPRHCSSHAPGRGQDGAGGDGSNGGNGGPDHRELGLKQELFLISPYSPGSPIFLPRGTRIFNRLVDFLRQHYVRYGFDEVITPTIYKQSLWARSGHLENYAQDMFTVSSPKASASSSTHVGADSAAATDNNIFRLKPMNCPGHCLIFASQRRSYRDLPLRYADFSPLHRDEVSGSLSGLTRLRRFHQDDGHIFCRPAQAADEIHRTLDFIRIVYDALCLGPYRLVLSTRPAEQYIGELTEWNQAETALKQALDRSSLAWTLNEGDGAFYGPKIDVILQDSDGKEHQTATVQLDFQLPKRFGLEYQAPAPELEQRGDVTTDADLLSVYGPVRPVMIHRAVLGSVERLMALLIEHYRDKWPLWLNPRQGIIITVNDSEPVLAWARKVHGILVGTNPVDTGGQDQGPTGIPAPAHARLAIDQDDSARSVSLKVREAKTQGYSIIMIIGSRNVDNGTVSVDASAISLANGERMKRDMQLTPNELNGLIHGLIKQHR